LYTCHCMSLPLATQNTHYHLQAGCGLASAMTSLQNGSKIKERLTQKFIWMARKLAPLRQS
jgi:hypothetical protein